MRRALWGVLICLHLFVSADTYARTTDWSAVVKNAHRQVLRLEIQQGDDKGFCSGIVINAEAGFILGAAHCVGPMGTKDLSITVDGKHAEVVRSNTVLDLAVLRFQPKDVIAVPLASETPALGTEVAVLGYLLGAKNVHTQYGRIAAPRNDEGYVVLDVSVLGGDSGGPAINAQGELVGLVVAYYRGSAIALAIPVETIREFVESYLPPPRRGAL